MMCKYRNIKKSQPYMDTFFILSMWTSKDVWKVGLETTRSVTIKRTQSNGTDCNWAWYILYIRLKDWYQQLQTTKITAEITAFVLLYIYSERGCWNWHFACYYYFLFYLFVFFFFFVFLVAANIKMTFSNI